MSGATNRNQQVGALGIAWATVRAIQNGWTALATTRHQAGADIWLVRGQRSAPLQVKAVCTDKRGRPFNVSLGSATRPGNEKFLAVVVVDNADALQPVATYVLPFDRALALARNYKGSLWLQPNEFATDEFREAWHLIEPPSSAGPAA
jgi:hypothetical protein